MHKFQNLKYVYLATEDMNAYKIFKKELKNKLIHTQQYRFDLKKSKHLLYKEKANRKDHHYKLALEYLNSLNILSKTSYFIGGRCNGSLFVWLMHKKRFIYFCVKNLGTYQDKSLKQIFKYCKYKVLSKILIGKKKEYYQNKLAKMM